MPEPVLLLVGLLAAAAFVTPPLLRRAPDAEPDAGERDAARVRHRVALEALRDVEADRRAGSLDDAAYAEQLADAEARAAGTRAALEAAAAAPRPREAASTTSRTGAATAGLVAAGAIGAALLVGAMLPATGVANRTVANQALADAQDAETARQARITELLGALERDGADPAVLSELADAYLAGTSREDLARAAVALQGLIGLEPDRADAYERIMSAYVRAGDFANARAVHNSYADIPTANRVELAFFDGIIALRGENDPAAAAAAFDRFLERAPDDPRAGMVRGMRDEAAAE